MKKALLVMLIAVLAITSVFAYSDVTAKIGYDLMSFGIEGAEKTSLKYNGLSFGIRGDVDVINGVCATASVDGIVPFFEKEGSSDWSKTSDNSHASYFGLKTKLGASYEIDFGRVDLALGVNGIFGNMFMKGKGDNSKNSITYMNLGMGADICVDFNVTPHLTLGFELQPELMFPKTWVVTNINGTKSYNSTNGSASFTGSAQVAATVIF